MEEYEMMPYLVQHTNRLYTLIYMYVNVNHLFHVFFTFMYGCQNLLKSVGWEGNLSCLCQHAALLSTLYGCALKPPLV